MTDNDDSREPQVPHAGAHAEPTASDLEAAISTGYARRERANMAPTIAYFAELLDAYPGNPLALYELGGAYDTAGEESTARGFYESALAAGIEGDSRRRCLLQYGSTLRNLELFDESIEILERARTEFPRSDSVRAFLALSLHASARSDAAVAELLELVADGIRSDELTRYYAALRGNATYLRGLDADSQQSRTQ